MKRWLFALMLCCFLFSCKKKEEEPMPTGERVILVYMLSDNTLGYNNDHKNDLNEMSEAVSLGKLNGARIFVYNDAAGTDPQLVELVTNGGTHVEQKRLKNYESRNSATGESLAEVIADVQKIAPSLRRGLILWSHASGWLPPKGGNNKSQKSNLKSFGDDNGNEMEIAELAAAIPHQHYDFIIADACNMACIEVAYQLRDKTKMFVSYPTEVLFDGMPYNKVLPLLGKARVDFRAVCKEVYNSYVGTNQTVAITAINCEKLEKLADVARKAMSKGLTEENPTPYISYAEKKQYQFADLRQILSVQCEALNTLEINEIENAVDEAISVYLHTPTFLEIPLSNKSCGVAIADYVHCTQSEQKYLLGFDWWCDVLP